MSEGEDENSQSIEAIQMLDVTARCFPVISLSSFESNQLYTWLEQHQENNRFLTRRAHPNKIELWQRAIQLRSFMFYPGSSTSVAVDEAIPNAKLLELGNEFALLQMILGVNTSKLALDACLDGLYSQALALCRTMAEIPRRMAYVRRSPEEVVRWVPSEMVSDDVRNLLNGVTYRPMPRPQDWDRVFEPQDDHDDADKGRLDLIGEHINDLHEHVHPTASGALQHMTDSRYHINLHPTFQPRVARSVLRLGCIFEWFLMTETMFRFGADDAWIRALKLWKQRFQQEFPEDDSILEPDHASPSDPPSTD